MSDIIIRIGKMNSLPVLRLVEFGAFLDGGGVAGDILLPNRYMPEGCDVGDVLDVFLCYDSEDRLMATTQTPAVMVGEFAVLRVVDVEAVGAFLDWGLSKDLFLPHAEQSRDLDVGDEIVVFVYLDKSGRISASMRVERNLAKLAPDFKEGDSVELMIFGKSDLGFKALINLKHMGMLYANEVFQPLEYAQKIPGFIKKIRPDGKIDLSLRSLEELQKVGHQAADDIAPKILELLTQKKGFLPINDKTSADTIYQLFSCSKKKYKIALGGLYKLRLITVDEEGIRLVLPK